FGGRFPGDPFPGVLPLIAQILGDLTERPIGITAGFLQLSNQLEQDVELAHAAQTPARFSETTDELLCERAVELKHRKQLPDAARRDTGAMNGLDLAVFNAV